MQRHEGLVERGDVLGLEGGLEAGDYGLEDLRVRKHEVRFSFCNLLY